MQAIPLQDFRTRTSVSRRARSLGRRMPSNFDVEEKGEDVGEEEEG